MVFTLALPFSAFFPPSEKVEPLSTFEAHDAHVAHNAHEALTTPAAHRRQLTLKMNGSWPLKTLLV